jgi:hypothetical protein
MNDPTTTGPDGAGCRSLRPDGGRNDADSAAATDTDDSGEGRSERDAAAASGTPVEADHDGEGSETDAAGSRDANGTNGGLASAGRVRRYLLYLVVVGLLLLAAVAVVNFYLAANAAITQWIEPEFRQPFRAAFNLVVVLLSAAGIFAVLRRL